MTKYEVSLGNSKTKAVAREGYYITVNHTSK